MHVALLDMGAKIFRILFCINWCTEHIAYPKLNDGVNFWRRILTF